MKRFILLFPLCLVFQLNAQQISWITACAPQTFCLDPNSCTQGQVYLVEKAVTNCGNSNINYSYKIDLNSDNVIDIQSSNDTVSGPIAKGTHKITWKATDNCGNLLQCTYTFYVKDCQPPNLLCINGLTQGIDLPDCLTSFSASQFILTLNDNCTPTNQIQLGIRKAGDGTGFPTDTTISFNSCEKGFNSIEVWAKDKNGLANLCSNYVLVQDGNNDCLCNNDADIHFNGCTRTGLNTRIDNFKLKTVFETLPGAASPLLTNYSQIIEDSCYTLNLDHIPFGNDYQAVIRAERLSGPVVGVTTYDLVLTSKHILALEPFTNIYQLVAADVNKSGSVTTFDVVETRKLILGIYDTFPKVPAWRFTRPVANPAQLSNFGALKDTYQITLTNLIDDITLQHLDFIGIKYGDVNSSASLTGDPAAEERFTAPPLLLQTEDRWLEAGETAVVPFKMAEALMLEGWQLGLKADPAKLQILEATELPADQYTLDGMELRALWADGAGALFDDKNPLISVKVRALQGTKLSDALALSAEKLRPEAYTPKAGALPDRRALLLHFGPNDHAGASFFPARPNPFSNETFIDVLLESPTNGLLEIFDLNGKQVYVQNYSLDKGLQTLQIPASALPAEGVFAYRISAGKTVAQGRLLRF